MLCSMLKIATESFVVVMCAGSVNTAIVGGAVVVAYEDKCPRG